MISSPSLRRVDRRWTARRFGPLTTRDGDFSRVGSAARSAPGLLSRIAVFIAADPADEREATGKRGKEPPVVRPEIAVQVTGKDDVMGIVCGRQGEFGCLRERVTIDRTVRLQLKWKVEQTLEQIV